jgi:hypothetical protein
MIKILRKAMILLVVFVFGVAGTAFLLNSETTDDRSDMNDATFPEVMVEYGGTASNRMYGYAQVMQADFIRDSITPLDTTKKLVFLVNPYDTKVNSLSYEIRTSDGSRIIENRKIKNLTTSDSYLKTTVEISSDLLLNQEYSMQITLDTNKGEIYYYTRVISRSGLNTEHYVEFVQSFYESCMDKAASEDLANYIEPEDTGSPTNYSSININSSLSEISWGSLSPQISKKGIPVIKDINETTASIELEYQITAKNESGQTETYDVKEFYRLKYSETRIRLLNFERSTTQVFDPSLSVITDEGLLLGVRDKNVSYLSDEEGTMIAFTQQGDLWTYEPDSGKIVKVFTFRKDKNGDFRDSRSDHDIKIIRVDSSGDVDFVLYGYMNRGAHEGYTGVCVYHYNSEQNVLEEKVFIPSTESADFLEYDMGILSYVSEDNCLFLLLAQKLYQVDINEGTFAILEENISTSQFMVSETNAHAAWRVTSGEDKGNIKLIDFETREIRVISPAQSQQLRILGFMNEDLVYGILLDGDTLTDSSGHKTEGLYSFKIEDFEGNLKKEYHEDGFYVTSVTVGSTLMEFELSAKSGDSYVYKKKDNIVNNKKSNTKKITVEMTQISRTGIQVRLSLEDTPGTDQALLIVSKIKSSEEKSVTLDTQIPDDNVYYVYAQGGLDRIYTNVASAVNRADSVAGVVLNRSQQYIWERGNKKTQQMINVEDLPETMRNGIWDAETLQAELGEEGTVLDLSGCTLDQVLYEVSAQRPILVKLASGQVVVIIGYDAYNTYLYHPETGETEIYGLNDSTELFENGGNLFLSYVETASH